MSRIGGDNLKTLKFEDYESFVDMATDDFDAINEDDKDIAIVAKYEDARQIIKELMLADWNIRFITGLECSEFGGYDDEFVIHLTAIDEDYEVWCEPMKQESGNCIFVEATHIFILDNCSSKVIPYCEGLLMSEVEIGDDEEDEFDVDDSEEECCEYHCNRCCENTKLTGDSHERYFVNGIPTSREIFDEYDKVLRLRMNEILDEMDEWRKLFRW